MLGFSFSSVVQGAASRAVFPSRRRLDGVAQPRVGGFQRTLRSGSPPWEVQRLCLSSGLRDAGPLELRTPDHSLIHLQLTARSSRLKRERKGWRTGRRMSNSTHREVGPVAQVGPHLLDPLWAHLLFGKGG